MNKTATSCLAVLAIAATSAFGQASLAVPNDDDGNPFRFLPAVDEVAQTALNDDDGNPIVLLPLHMAPIDLADRANIPSLAR